jgi:hypothetical protein
VAFNGGETASVTGGDGSVALLYRGGRGKVRRTAIGSHDARRSGSPRRRKPTSVVARTPGDEAVGQPEDVTDMLGGEMRGDSVRSGCRRTEGKRE